jgi:hypothetical protein
MPGTSTFASQRRRGAWLGVPVNVGLAATVFFPWKLTTITTSASPTTGAVGPQPMGLGATQRAVAGAHQVLAIESVVRAALEVTVLGAAIAGLVVWLLPWLAGRESSARVALALAATELAAAAAACWLLPALQPQTALTVHLGMQPTLAAYTAFALSIAALAAVLTIQRPPQSPLVPPAP